jgi:hypothetical protein
MRATATGIAFPTGIAIESICGRQLSVSWSRSEPLTSGSRDRRATRQIVLGRSILVDRFEFSGDHIQESRYRPAQLRSKRDATMKKLWLVAVAGLALSTSAAGRVYHRRVLPPPPPPPACNPVASWTDVNSNVCIKYVCAGGGFQIRCLPAPPLLPEGPGPVH